MKESHHLRPIYIFLESFYIYLEYIYSSDNSKQYCLVDREHGA